MKYWLFQSNQVLGPFDKEHLAEVKGFGAESLVCPEGRKGTDMGDWQRAGIVAELGEALLRTGRVATATRSVGESLLPPEPTLRDLAVLGTLQEKTTLLENALGALQEDFRARDTEIAKLKVDLATKERDLLEMQAKVAEMEGRLVTLGAVKEELTKDEQQIQDIQNRLLEAKDELKRDIAKTTDEEHAAAAKLAEAEARLTEQERLIGDLRSRVERGVPGGTPLGGPMGPSRLGSSGPVSRSAQPMPAPLGLQPLGADLSLPGPMPGPKPPEKLEPLTLPGGAPPPLVPQPLVAAGPSAPPTSGMAPPNTAPGPARPLEFISPLDAPDARAPSVPGLMDMSSGMPVPKAAPAMSMPPLQPLETGAAAAASGKKGPNKLLIGIIAGGVLVAGGLFFLAPMILKPKAPKGPTLKPASLPPPAALAVPTSPAAPEAPAMPPPQVPAQDPSQAATDMAKSYMIPGLNMTVVQRMETAFPPDPTGNLSPWMVEKLGEDKYQVVFYANKNKLAYEFRVTLSAKTVEGINAPAQAVLNGEDPTPPPPKPEKPKREGAPKIRATKRRAARPRAAPSAGSDVLVPSLGEGAAEGSPKQGAVPAENASAEKSASEAPADAAPAGEDNKTLDELLLPGMPKAVSKKGARRAKPAPAAGAPAPEDAPPSDAAPADPGQPSQ